MQTEAYQWKVRQIPAKSFLVHMGVYASLKCVAIDVIHDFSDVPREHGPKMSRILVDASEVEIIGCSPGRCSAGCVIMNHASLLIVLLYAATSSCNSCTYPEVAVVEVFGSDDDLVALSCE